MAPISDNDMWQGRILPTEDNLRSDIQRLKLRVEAQALELAQKDAQLDEVISENKRLCFLIQEHDKTGHNQCWENCRELRIKALGEEASLYPDTQVVPLAEFLRCCVEYTAAQRELLQDDEELMKKLKAVLFSYL